MRSAKVNDLWRHVDSRKQFPQFVEKIDIKSVEGFSRLDIQIGSGISVFCGRNGSGKSTFLKIIYEVLTKNNKFKEIYSSGRNLSGVTIGIRSRADGLVEYAIGDDRRFESVEYFDSAENTIRIANRIRSDANPLDFIEGLEPSSILNDKIELIKRITGKKYSNIEVFELEGVIEGYVIPYIFVTQGEIKYSNETMGTGELKLLILLWKLLSLEKGSMVLLEEPETFICPRSQTELIDFIAFVSDIKKICFIMTSHSEHIISRVNQYNCFVMTDNLKNGFSLIPNKHSFKYVEALGLTSKKVGTILVEDSFAKKLLFYILSNYDSSIRHEYYIDNLKGESNIEKCIKHNVCTENHKLIAVFDADYKGSICERDYLWPIAYLPSTNNSPPEVTVIESIKADLRSYARWIHMGEDFVEDAVNGIACDHHDFFIELSACLGKDLAYLRDGAIEFWVHNNHALIAEFLFQLENIGEKVSGVIEELAGSFVFRAGDIGVYDLCSVSRRFDAQKLVGSAVDAEMIYENGTLACRLVMPM